MPRYSGLVIPGLFDYAELIADFRRCSLPARTPDEDTLVVVNALVGVQGRVLDARVLRSVPSADRDVVACVRQLIIRPTLLHDIAVQTWVAVPVRLSDEARRGEDASRSFPVRRFGADQVSQDVRVFRWAKGAVRLDCAGQWEGVAFEDEHGFEGTLRFEDARRVWGAMSFRADRESDGRFRCSALGVENPRARSTEMWTVGDDTATPPRR